VEDESRDLPRELHNERCTPFRRSCFAHDTICRICNQRLSFLATREVISCSTFEVVSLLRREQQAWASVNHPTKLAPLAYASSYNSRTSAPVKTHRSTSHRLLQEDRKRTMRHAYSQVQRHIGLAESRCPKLWLCTCTGTPATPQLQSRMRLKYRAGVICFECWTQADTGN